MYTATGATEAALTHSDHKGDNVVELFRAKNIGIPFSKLENEVIPLGLKQIEVILAEVPITSLKLDPTNPRIRYELEATGKGSKATPEELRNILWKSPEVKKLKRSIEQYQGLIEAIIISGKDGTVLEGNCRLTCYLQLAEEDPEKWGKIRARILPPEVTRETVDDLLGQLHIAGKNEWSPFEQAAHFAKLAEKAVHQEDMAQAYRVSKTYVNAKLRAYNLMNEYLDMVRESGKEVKQITEKWSWFEEFYKKCKPGKEFPNRVYNGRDLEVKFCEWMLNDQLPQAADVRRLYDCLEDKKAIAILDRGGGIDKAHNQAAATKPELKSKLWKQIEDITEVLNNTPMSEIDALRTGDDAKAEKLTNLLQALRHVMHEAKLKS